MNHAQPIHVIWWLVSRASGILAMALMSASVLLGLTMATNVVRRTGAKRAIARVHEHSAVLALAAIAAHGASLLGDRWLHPGWDGITVPFALSYRPAFTGLGIVAGYLAVLLGPSFYLRKRIGARRWRRLHRATVIAWLLAAAHTLGSGSDASKLWLRCIALAPLVPIVYLSVLRLELRLHNGRVSVPLRVMRAVTCPVPSSGPRRPPPSRPAGSSSRGTRSDGRGRSSR